jgi:flagellar biosynthesis/type III secretory pathway protein FliH
MAPRAVRVLALSAHVMPAPPAARLLELRDAAADEDALREAVAACCAATERALGELRATVEARLHAVASMSAELGLAVAQEIVGAAIAQGTFDIAAAVRRCLQEATVANDRAVLRVRLAPQDYARARAAFAAHDLASAQFAADPSLAPGTARVETDAGAWTYDPAEVLRRMSDEVRKELRACP